MKITEDRRHKIRRYMRDNQINQRDMAFRLGISYSTLYRILTGRITTIQDATAEILAPILGEDHESVEPAPRIRRPCIAVVSKSDALVPHIQPGDRYIAVQEELDLINDGEIVVTEIWDTMPSGKQVYRPIIGFLRKCGEDLEIDCGSSGRYQMSRSTLRWIAHILRPVSEIVIGGD